MRPEQNGSLQAVTWETAPQTKEETLELLRRSPGLYRSYRALNDSWKEQFLDFCQGKKSLPLTYDPFFKYLGRKKNATTIKASDAPTSQPITDILSV